MATHTRNHAAVSVYRALEAGALRNFDNHLRLLHIAKMIFIGY
jgi:hypothetical protein